MGIGSKYGIIAETGNNIVTDGLVFYINPAYQKSYTSGSSDVFNLASGSLTPTGSFSSTGMWENTDDGIFAFDGVGDYMSFGPCSSYVDNVSQLSVDFWFKIDDTGESRWAGKSSHTSQWISCQLNSNSDIYYVIANGSLTYGGFEAIDSGLVAADTWYHLACVFDGTQTGNANRCKIYLNADSKTLNFQGSIPSTTFDFTTVTNPNWRVGGDGLVDNADGNIASFHIYDRALTAGDVLQNFNAGKDRFGL